MTLLESKLAKSQKKTFHAIGVVYGEKADIIATVRYDDECGNKHNSFSITGDIYKHGKPRTDHNYMDGGCVHDEIEKHFPELAPFIKWHLTSSDGPMHYIANTTYHARETDTDGFKPGEVTRHSTQLKFVGVPFRFDQQGKGFWEYLDGVGDFNNIEVEAVEYDEADTYNFEPNYSLTGFIKENESKKWYRAPFKNKSSAAEFLETLQTLEYRYVKTPIKWAKAVDPNIEAARNSAVWPDATLGQLQDKKALEDRLPALMAEFKHDIESLGFIY